nr:MAG TPA: PGDYG protein [Caudoviricetes sp.]
MHSSRSYRKCKQFVGDSWIDYYDMPNGLPGIKTLEGVMEISNGDYIIRGIQGEFYACKQDVFHLTYELI